MLRTATIHIGEGLVLFFFSRKYSINHGNKLNLKKKIVISSHIFGMETLDCTINYL